MPNALLERLRPLGVRNITILTDATRVDSMTGLVGYVAPRSAEIRLDLVSGQRIDYRIPFENLHETEWLASHLARLIESRRNPTRDWRAYLEAQGVETLTVDREALDRILPESPCLDCGDTYHEPTMRECIDCGVPVRGGPTRCEACVLWLEKHNAKTGWDRISEGGLEL